MNKKQVDTGVSHEEVALCAYHVWEEQGRPAGQDKEIWLQAEAWLNAVRRHELEKAAQSAGEKIKKAPPKKSVKAARKVKPAVAVESSDSAAKKSPASSTKNARANGKAAPRKESRKA